MNENQSLYIADGETLERLLNISLGLLEFNGDDKCYKWGEALYEIHKELKSRFEMCTENGTPEHPEKIIIRNVFKGNIQTVNIYNNELPGIAGRGENRLTPGRSFQA